VGFGLILTRVFAEGSDDVDIVYLVLHVRYYTVVFCFWIVMDRFYHSQPTVDLVSLDEVEILRQLIADTILTQDNRRAVFKDILTVLERVSEDFDY